MTWKTINGYPNYEVSNDGRVRKKAVQIVYNNGTVTNYREKMLKPDASSKGGRLRVTLSQRNVQKRIQVHRLVAEHFLPPDPARPHVNHKDGNPQNNHVDNLEWCTPSENELHSYRVLGKINPIRKLTDEQAACVRSQRWTRPSREIAKEYGVDKAVILHIWHGRTYATA